MALPGTGRLPSLTSSAVYVTVSATLSTAVNWTFPVASVVAVVPEMMELPLPCERLTTLPGDGLPFSSCKVTVIVVVSLPFALTVVGLALMPPAVAGGLPKLIVAVWFSLTPPAVAVKVTVSGVASVIVNTMSPPATEETPLAGLNTA